MVKLGLNVVIISLLQVVTGLGELEILKPGTKEKHRFIKKSDFHELHIIPTSSDIQTFMSSSLYSANGPRFSRFHGLSTLFWWMILAEWLV